MTVRFGRTHVWPLLLLLFFLLVLLFLPPFPLLLLLLLIFLVLPATIVEIAVLVRFLRMLPFSHVVGRLQVYMTGLECRELYITISAGPAERLQPLQQQSLIPLLLNAPPRDRRASPGRTCWYCIGCHLDKAANRSCFLNQSQYTDTRPTISSSGRVSDAMQRSR